MLRESRIVIKRDTILAGIFMLAILVEHNFFGLFSISKSIYNVISLACTLILFFSVVLNKQRLSYLRNMKSMLNYFIVLAVFLVVQFVYTIIKYDAQTIESFLQVANPYIYILLSFYLVYVFRKEESIDRVLDMITFFVVINMAIYIVEAFLYNSANITLFNYLEYKTALTRNGRLRLWDLSSLEGLAAIWLFYCIMFKKGKKLKNIVFLIIVFFALYYIEQTRIMQTSLIVSFVVIYLFNPSKNTVALLRKAGIIALMLLIIVITGVVDSFLSTFSSSGELGSSTVIRQDEFVYAFRLFLKYPVNGLGLMPTSIRDLYYSYYGAGKLGFTDIGIVGLLAQVGLWSVVLYIIPVLRFAFYIPRIKKNNIKEIPFLAALLSYLFITSVTLLILNSTRAFMWPFCIALFEYFIVKTKHFNVLD